MCECLSPEKLILYSDSSLSPEERASVEEHLKTCSECRAEAETFSSFFKMLKIGAVCPNAQKLSEYKSSESKKKISFIKEHVKNCPECSHLLELISAAERDFDAAPDTSKEIIPEKVRDTLERFYPERKKASFLELIKSFFASRANFAFAVSIFMVVCCLTVISITFVPQMYKSAALDNTPASSTFEKAVETQKGLSSTSSDNAVLPQPETSSLPDKKMKDEMTLSAGNGANKDASLVQKQDSSIRAEVPKSLSVKKQSKPASTVVPASDISKASKVEINERLNSAPEVNSEMPSQNFTDVSDKNLPNKSKAVSLDRMRELTSEHSSAAAGHSTASEPLKEDKNSAATASSAAVQHIAVKPLPPPAKNNEAVVSSETVSKALKKAEQLQQVPTQNTVTGKRTVSHRQHRASSADRNRDIKTGSIPIQKDTSSASKHIRRPLPPASPSVNDSSDISRQERIAKRNVPKSLFSSENKSKHAEASEDLAAESMTKGFAPFSNAVYTDKEKQDRPRSRSSVQKSVQMGAAPHSGGHSVGPSVSPAQLADIIEKKIGRGAVTVRDISQSNSSFCYRIQKNRDLTADENKILEEICASYGDVRIIITERK